MATVGTVEITYKDVTTEIEAGKIATLACKGKTMKSNIVVRCPPYVSYGGSISYNGKITDVSGNRSATLLCKDKRMKDDVVIKANEEPFVEIQFSIANKTYYAQEGMTWGEWVDSEYNTNGYFIDNGGGVQIGQSWVYYYDKKTNYTYYQDSASIIVAGRAYGISHGGGSN